MCKFDFVINAKNCIKTFSLANITKKKKMVT